MSKGNEKHGKHGRVGLKQMEETYLGFKLGTIVVLFVLLIATSIVSVVVGYSMATGNSLQTQSDVVVSVSEDKDTIKASVEKYVKENLLSNQDISFSVSDVNEVADNFFELSFEIKKDDELLDKGKIYYTRNRLILGSVFDVSVPLPRPAPPVGAQPVKSDKPVVDLFVMSFCPYGIQALESFKPAVQLLNDKIEFEVGYVIYPRYAKGYGLKWGDYCTDANETYCSMHGIGELNEDVRQMCIQKYQRDKFWDYLSLLIKDYNENKVSASNIESKWKTYAQSAGVDVAKVEQCFESEKIDLLDEQVSLAARYAVRGSPTGIINGVTYSGARDAESFKKAICDSFNTAPTVCDEKLSASVAAPTGNC